MFAFHLFLLGNAIKGEWSNNLLLCLMKHAVSKAKFIIKSIRMDKPSFFAWHWQSSCWLQNSRFCNWHRMGTACNGYWKMVINRTIHMFPPLPTRCNPHFRWFVLGWRYSTYGLLYSYDHLITHSTTKLHKLSTSFRIISKQRRLLLYVLYSFLVFAL